MGNSVNTNIVALNAQRNLSTSQSSLSQSMQRLSSGLRVNSAKDDAAGLAIGGGASGAATNIATTSQIDDAINAIDKAMDSINDQRANFGASQNRFEAVISNLQTNIENQAAARGRIVDADFATETANLSRSQILQQAGTAMIAQANQLPQQVLSLLR